MNKPTQLLELRNKIKDCRCCQSIFGFEPNPLFWGDQDAKVVQISQAPSSTAHRGGKVWVDKGGERLKYRWYQISDEQFYNSKNFYITALAHCYPGKTKFGDKNPPNICAKKWLAKELEVLTPKLFVVIGGLAAGFLFPDRNFTKLIFNNQTLRGKLCFVLPHPSPQNIKWLKDHPTFETTRLPQIRRYIHKVLGEI